MVSDAKLRNAKPKEANYRIQIGDNTYLDVLTTGKKVWRMRYTNPYTKKPAIYTIGPYPSNDMDRGEPGFFFMIEARIEAHRAKQLIRNGIDPTDERRKKRLVAQQQQQAEIRARTNTFEKVARAWHHHRFHTLKKWKPQHAHKIMVQLDTDVFPIIGKMPIDQVTAPTLLDVVQVLIDRGTLEAAKKLNQRLNSILRYAVTRKMVQHNEADNLRDEIPTPERKNNPHLTIDELPEFVRALDQDETTGEVIKLALQFTMHTLARTQETRFARWEEFDLEARTWSLSAERMKMDRPHIVPIPDQVVQILEKLRPLTGSRPYLFVTRGKPISENAMLSVVYRLGYKGRLTVHGLRGTASTILNDAGFRHDVVETALAHVDQNRVRGSYNHALYLPERAEMLEWYSNLLDSMRDGAKVIPINRMKA